MRKIVFCDDCFIFVKFHGNFFIRTSSLFVAIKMMFKDITNQKIFCWTIESFMYAFISHHDDKLRRKANHLLQFFLSQNIFQIFIMMHQTWTSIKNYEILTLFCIHNW
jgi:hypothetical protein